MSIRRFSAFVLACGFSLLAQTGWGATVERAPHAEGQVVVRYQPGMLAGADGAKSKPESLRAIENQFKMKKARRLGFDSPGRRVLDKKTLGGIKNPNRPTRAIVESMEVIDFGGGADLDAIVKAYRADPMVLSAEPNYIYRLSSTPGDPYYVANQADDFGFVGLPAAWDVQTGSPSVVVAVIDSGCEILHEDLAAAISAAHWDFVDNHEDVSDDQGHGTRVCSIIGASGNNSKGMAGAAYGVTILPLDVVAGNGTISNTDVIEALDYAVAHGASIINMSFASIARSDLLGASIASASQSAVLVAAVGNDGRNDRPMYPAAYDGVIGVAACADGSGARADFSNYNGPTVTMVDLVAPGASVFGAIPGDQYDGIYGSGTSFAAPIVSGAAALMKSKYPAMSTEAMRRYLTGAATPAGEWAGHGILNADALLNVSTTPAITVQSVAVDDGIAYNPGVNNGDGRLDRNEIARLIVTLASGAGDGRNISATLSTANSSIGAIGHATVAFGNVLAGATATNSADPFTTITVSAAATVQTATFDLALSGDNGYADTLHFSLPIDDMIDISGVKFSYAFSADKTYHVTSNLSLRNATTIPAGTVFKVDPGVDVRVDSNCALTAVGTEQAPIVFTAARQSNAPSSVLGPHTQPVNLGSYQQVRYVSANTGSDTTGNGSAGNPWKSIQYALDQITNASVSIKYALLVAEGKYTRTTGTIVTMKPYVDMHGGFRATDWARDISAYVSMIDGENTRPCVVGANNACLDGFYVTRGLTGGMGAGINCDGKSLTITNCTVAFNRAYHGMYGIAGGVFIGWSSAQVSNCLIVGNSADMAGGIYVRDSTTNVTNCIIADNSGYGGGVVLESDATKVINCTVSGNQGGGIYCRSGFPTIVNTSICGNSREQGAAVSSDNNPFTLINCTIMGNVGQAFYTDAASTLINCVIRQNGTNAIMNSSFTVRNSNIDFTWNGSGGNNINSDPLFMAAPYGGIVTEATYNATNLTSVLKTHGEALVPNCLRGFVIRVGSRYCHVYSNTADTITVWGDVTQSGTIHPPLSWILEDYHIRAGSPNRGAGIGPGADVTVPTTDIEGDARSGATCDIGADQYNASTPPAAGNWGQFWVTPAASSATVAHCVINKGSGVLNETTSTTFSDCNVTYSSGAGFTSTAGAGELVRISSEGNRGAGIVAAARNLTDCVARYNGGAGISGQAILRCFAGNNTGAGISGVDATDSTATLNTGNGFTLTGTAQSCTAGSNRGRGVSTTGGAIQCVATANGSIGVAGSAVTDCLSLQNTGIGISGGTVFGSTSLHNSGGGISGTSVTDCMVGQNTGTGVSGGSVSGTSVVGNTGAAVTGATSVLNSAIAGNGSGISGAGTVTGVYVGGNAGVGVTGGAISNCSILGNTGNGLNSPTSSANSWILNNGGHGIYSTAGLTTIDQCSIQNNAGYGVYSSGGTGAVDHSTIQGNNGGVLDILSMHNSNLGSNGANEAVDNVSTGNLDRSMTQNYWGSANTALLDAAEPFVNMAFFTDAFDGSGTHYIDVWGTGRDYLTTATTASPDSLTPAFLLNVSPNTANPVCARRTVFTLTFSEAMNTAIEPTVTFDLTAPYTKNVVVADPGWVNATTWQGSFAIDIDTGDGTHTIKVLGARSADGFVIPDDTLHRFVVDTSGATVANLGLATISGVSQAVISWDNDSGGVVTPAGYNVLRSTTGAAGSYRQINTGLVAVSGGPKTSYIDSTMIAGTQYYWLVYRVDTNGNSEIWSGPMTNSEAEVDVRDGSTQVPNGGGPVELGSVAMGGTALTRTFTVYNYGYGTLSASNLSVSSPYAISEGLAATIPSGGSDTFTISLPTGTAGTFNATVSFTTNDANQPTCNFTITGRVEAVDADLIWVKFDYSGSEQGTQTFPYNTLGEGIGAVNSGGTVRIYSGSVGGAYRITRQTRLEAYGGSVRIGLATGLGEPSAGLDGANSHDSGQSRRNTTSGRSAATDWMLYR